jgi:DNA-binding MarR family transcriptional regulator
VRNMGTLEIAVGEELLEAIGTLRRQVRGVVGRPWPDTDLTSSQVDLIRLVHRNPHLGVAAAAAELGLAANTVSTLVRQLCTAGLLIREGDPDDGRAARLRLTDAAAERVEVWRDQRVARVNLALKHLNARDRARIESALPSLRRLSDQLRAEGAVAS